MSGTRNGLFYWDSCIYLAWFKKEQAYSEYLPAIGDLLEQSKRNAVRIITSTLTLLEVLNKDLEPSAEKEFRDLFDFEIHKPIDLDIVIALRARQYRLHYMNIGSVYPALPDSVHLATAFLNGVDEMHTFDDGKRGQAKERFSPLAHSGNIAGDALTISRPPKSAPTPPPAQGSLFS